MVAEISHEEPRAQVCRHPRQKRRWDRDPQDGPRVVTQQAGNFQRRRQAMTYVASMKEKRLACS